MSSEDLFERPVFIVGLPRSGTSLVTGMLQRCGLWLGRTMPGDAFNPKGYFENAALREGIVKPILRRFGVDPLGVHALPPPDAALAVPALKAMVRDALRQQDYEGTSRWGYKGNKLALIWQLWDTHFPRADWIIVQRSTADVIASCMNTPFMAQHSSDPMFWRDFVAKRAARLDELCASHVIKHEIDAGSLIAGDLNNMQRLVESLGLNWTAAARDFVNPRLWQTWQRESRGAG
jgi:hypothetical protein